MTTDGQFELFPETAPPVAEVIDIEVWMAGIRRGNAAREAEGRLYDPNGAPSEARVDQGWGSEVIDMTDVVSDEPPVVDLEAKQASMRRHPVSGNASVSNPVTEGPRVISPQLRSIIDTARQKLRS